MADIGECPVCFEQFKDPKILPCTHTLCPKCLQNLNRGRRITCPMCNAKHKVPERGVWAFPENQQEENIKIKYRFLISLYKV